MNEDRSTISQDSDSEEDLDEIEEPVIQDVVHHCDHVYRDIQEDDGEEGWLEGDEVSSDYRFGTHITQYQIDEDDGEEDEEEEEYD